MQISKIILYYNTVKYLRLVQTFGRVFSTLKKRYLSSSVAKVHLDNKHYKLCNKVSFIQQDPWNCREHINENRFTFLSIEKTFPHEKIDWSSEDMPLLWRFYLHYFNYLHLLKENERVQLCKEWIRANGSGNTVGWHSYPLSLRIVNWCKAQMNDPEINSSIFSQADHLYKNIENYHPGNHLLENARALVFAGLYFEKEERARKWFKTGMRILEKELRLQVLDDGGYFERSTMYHALMFECVLDIMNILPDDLTQINNFFYDIASKMSIFLRSMTHPDKKIALFNDSTFETALPTEELLKYYFNLTKLPVKQKNAFPDAGYYIFNDSNMYMTIDAGPIGPDFLPAHAHADIFSYELSLYSKRIIVDSGVYEYQAGEMRDYVRSTRAHNTVTVDDKSQAECWGSFRVARRYPPGSIVFDHGDNYWYFKGRFDGYHSLIGDKISHKRTIISEPRNKSLLVEDIISGFGNHKVKSYIHFHPDIKFQFVDNLIILNYDNKKIKLLVENGAFHFEKGWYCPRFGQKIPNNVLVMTAESLPAQLSYLISY
ncbi:MAG: heparinase II/III family protein [Clostridiales bacterium]